MNISPNAVKSKLISALIKKAPKNEESEVKEGIVLSSIAEKLFAKKRLKSSEEQDEVATNES